MNRDAIVAALETEYAKMNAVDPRTSDPGAVILRHEAAQRVASALSREREFEPGAGFYIETDRGYTGFQSEIAGNLLLQQALELDSPQRAVAWLEKVIASKNASTWCVMALWGIQCTTEVIFAPNIRLVPINELPESPQKAECERHRTPSSIFERSHMLGRPTAALVLASEIPKALHDLRDGEPATPKSALDNLELLDDIRLCLTCVGPCSPVEAAYWTQFQDEDLNRAVLGTATSFHNTEAMPMHVVTPPELDGDSAKAIVVAFLGLSDNVRAKVRVSLERLNFGMRRMWPADKAVEISTALESVLSDSDKEIKYSLSLRSAILLGGDSQTKVRTRALIAATYDVRSSRVHAGRALDIVKVPKLGRMKVEDVIAESARICADVLRVVITRGDLPDWWTLELSTE